MSRHTIGNRVEAAPQMYLSYFGIRVTDLDRSVRFYTELLGLKEVARGDSSQAGGGRYVLLRDRNSGQKLELNWYPNGSPYATTYLAGEGLDHIAFRVNDLAGTLKKLIAANVETVEIPPALREGSSGTDGASYQVKLAYVKDPDGNWIEFYEHSTPIPLSIPDGY